MRRTALPDSHLSRRNFLKYAVAGTVAVSTVALSNFSSVRAAGPKEDNMLILYFSHSGNTRNVAEQIHGRVGGDMIELKTVVPYPRDYNAVVEQAQREQQNDARPQIAAEIPNIEKYHTIFIGFPNWWGTIPMPFFTLLENMMSAAELSSPSAHMKAAVSDAANRISSVFVPARGCLKALKSAVQEPAEHKGTWTPGCAKLAF